MALETATFIDGLNASNPASTDGVAQADDHMRLIKSTLLATFPNIEGAVTLTHTEINALETRATAIEAGFLKADGTIPATADIPLGANKLTGVGDPSDPQDAATKASQDAAVAAEVTARNTAIQALFPVGSLYLSAVATNPATLLGFGTWVAHAAGRVLVGVGEGTDSNAVAKTFTLAEEGGEYVHTLLTAELPAHSHASAVRVSTGHASSSWDSLDGSTSAVNGYTTGTSNSSKTDAVYPHTDETGGDTAFAVEQPYVGVHIWKRTI